MNLLGRRSYFCDSDDFRERRVNIALDTCIFKLVVFLRFTVFLRVAAFRFAAFVAGHCPTRTKILVRKESEIMCGGGQGTNSRSGWGGWAKDKVR